MLTLMFVVGLIAALVVLPLILLGALLRLAFHIVLLPFGILGGLLGLGIAGIVLSVVGIVLFAVFGLIAAAGLLVFFGPLILVALILWAVLRHRRRPTATA